MRRELNCLVVGLSIAFTLLSDIATLTADDCDCGSLLEYAQNKSFGLTETQYQNRASTLVKMSQKEIDELDASTSTTGKLDGAFKDIAVSAGASKDSRHRELHSLVTAKRRGGNTNLSAHELAIFTTAVASPETLNAFIECMRICHGRGLSVSSKDLDNELVLVHIEYVPHSLADEGLGPRVIKSVEVVGGQPVEGSTLIGRNVDARGFDKVYRRTSKESIFIVSVTLKDDRGSATTVKSPRGTEIIIPPKPKPDIEYQIRIKTGNSGKDESDSRVFCRIVGSEGDSGKISLNKPDQDDRRKGAVDKYNFFHEDLGKVILAEVWIERAQGTKDIDDWECTDFELSIYRTENNKTTFGKFKIGDSSGNKRRALLKAKK